MRFSVATPSPEEPGSRGVLSLRSPVARTAAEGRRGPGTWDAAAVGTHPPQPRILKHLPPPAPSSPGGSGPGMGFAVTLPEAYEFFFCDTIEEGDEGAEEEAVDSQALAQAQWPDMCEFFFRDCGSQRPKSLQGSPEAPAPKAEPVPAPPPGSPVPMSIPEAYEHFFGEDRCGGMLGPSTLLQPHTLEPPRLAPWELRPGPPPKPSPGAAEQLSLVVRQAGACCWGPTAPSRSREHPVQGAQPGGHQGGPEQVPGSSASGRALEPGREGRTSCCCLLDSGGSPGPALWLLGGLVYNGLLPRPLAASGSGSRRGHLSPSEMTTGQERSTQGNSLKLPSHHPVSQ